MQFITFLDYLLLPFVIGVVYMIAIRIRDEKYPPGHPWRAFFMSGLTVKIMGGIMIGLIYQYYYGGGDTANYFFHARVINSSFTDSPIKWINLVLNIPEWYDGRYTEYTAKMYWYQAHSEYMVCSITSFISFFLFTTYLPTAVIFAVLSFSGIWAMFRTFSAQYPVITKPLAICFLFIPSVVLWGSGIFKDTLCLGSMGWMTYGIFRILIMRDFSFKNIILVVISFYLIAVIKIYILIAFIPALVLWTMFYYLQRVPSKFARFSIRLALLPIALVGFMFASKKFEKELGKYSLDNVAKTATVTADWIGTMTAAGEESIGYDLGPLDPSPQGMLKKFFPAVNVTLFRPYIWETRKVIQVISALEAVAFLLITIRVLLSVGPIKVWKSIVKDPNLQFALIFVLVFAFAVGISSFNFGSLSRYRIPCLPFYAMALILVFYKHNPPDKKILPV
ncbi:MAG: hypothetical protein EOP56_08665 [Sphingobacteriales bacterium]|nr:MAG: hypothetical protein EOP56_08665 [Sphingobacteriales bacterium]